MQKNVVMALALFFLTVNFCSAGELTEGLDLGARVAYLSHYVWRGQTLVDNPVLQSTADISSKGFHFNFLANADIYAEDEFTEVDFTVDYTADLGFLLPEEGDVFDAASLRGGYTFYTFPNLDTKDTSHEFFAGVSLDTFLNPSYTAYWDVDTGDGWYHEWAIGHTFDFDPLAVGMGLALGLNVDQWGYETSFTSLNFSNTVSIPLSAVWDTGLARHVTLYPTVASSLSLDSQYDNELYGGIAVGIDI